MKESVIQREMTLPRGIEEVFRFFSDPQNLGAITPPWLHFEVVACSTASITEGTVIDYRLRVRGLPLRWRSVIRGWQPPSRFTDEQVVGPYRRWIHEHSFADQGGATRVRDRVRYAVPGGALVDRLLVRPDLERIFDFRAERLAALLGR